MLNFLTVLILTFKGKSSAIQCVAQHPLEHLDLINTVMSKTTSSGMVKLLATQKKGFILSREVFDVFNKLMKSDKDNARSDIQLLCKLFSGEWCSYHYSTEESQVTSANMQFSIHGSTQLLNATKLITKMDHGHGLIARILCYSTHISTHLNGNSWWLQRVLRKH